MSSFLDAGRIAGLCSASRRGLAVEVVAATGSTNADLRERADCLGVISITLLHDVYIDPGSFAWLRERTPVGRVGSSLVLFDLRKR